MSYNAGSTLTSNSFSDTSRTSKSVPNLTSLESSSRLMNGSPKLLSQSNHDYSHCNGASIPDSDSRPRASSASLSSKLSSIALGSSPSTAQRGFIPLESTPEVVNRPSFLPPKSQAELQKHMKEFKEISKHIKEALDKEAKEKAKRDQQKNEREKKMSEFRRVWVDEVLPNWDKKKTAKKVQEMWRHGLPPSVRGLVWRKAIGNDLRITQDLYEIYQGHARQARQALGQSDVGELLGKEVTVALLDLDLPLDFPARQLFAGPDGPMHHHLTNVLGAYVSYRPDVGYNPSMSYVASLLLLYMDPLEAFVALANLLNHPFLMPFYMSDRTNMHSYIRALDVMVEALLPKIHRNFQEIGVTPEEYLVDWMMTMFSKCMNLDVAARVWDVFLLEGELFLFRTSLAVLKMYSHQLESYNRDMCMNLLTHFPEDLNPDDLFSNISAYNIDPKKFAKLLQTTSNVE